MTLQRRVLSYLALAAIASCALTVAVGVVLVRHRISAQRLSALEAQAAVLAAAGGASGTPGTLRTPRTPGALAPGDHVYRILNGRARRLGPLRASVVLAAVPAGADAQGEITVAGRELLYVSRLTAAGRIVLIRAAALAFAEWRPFLASLILAGLGGVLLAVLLSVVLARRLARPLHELSLAAGRVASGESGVAVAAGGEDEIARLGDAFNAMSRALGQARDAQRTFLESVSHELKTPLTSVRGYAEAIADRAVAPADGARVITAEADRLERLVSDLLELARLGRAGFTVARGPVDLGAIADEAVERHQPAARELSVELRSRVVGASGAARAAGAGADATAIADAGRLLQIVSNLIENALRLTPPGGAVTVAARPGGLTVSDTGPGLAEQDLPHVFERFYLHNRYRSERPVGTGLGLAIVKQLVVAMDGRIEVSSPPEGGTEFTIELPPVN